MPELRSLLSSLADRGRPRTEAMVQADVRQLLLQAPLGLDHDQVVALEAPVGGRRRIDVEVGYTVIEVKRTCGPGGCAPTPRPSWPATSTPAASSWASGMSGC